MRAPRDLLTCNFTRTSGNVTSWSPERTRADLLKIKDLGFNSVRSAIWAVDPASNFLGGYAFPQPTPDQLAIVRDYCEVLADVGLTLQLLLFDHWHRYGCVDGSRTWAAAVVGACDPDVLACVELQNEIRFAHTDPYPSGEFDGGWTGSRDVTLGGAALGWARAMMPYLRELSPAPVTLSCTNYGHPPKPYADLRAAVHGLTGEAAPDWWEWHCYTASHNIPDYLAGVLALLPDGRDVRIGEYGMSTTRDDLTESQAQQAQADYAHAVRYWCQRLGLPEPAPWEAFDDRVPHTFGLFTTDGAAKRITSLYEAHPPTSSGEPLAALDDRLTFDVTVVDEDDVTQPARWMLYRGNTSEQPIEARVADEPGHGGGVAVALTGSGATRDGDNAPALQFATAERRVVPGEQYTFRVWLRGTGDTGASRGYPRLFVAWFTADVTGSYLSSTNGDAVDLTSGCWTEATVTGTAPSDAALVRLQVAVGWNAGTVLVSDPHWSAPPEYDTGGGRVDL